MSENRPVRCSDAEREQTTQAVNEAAGEGRLSLTEVEERITAVYSARYRHELAEVVADLPALAAAPHWTPLVLLSGFGTVSPRRRLAIAALMLLALTLALLLAAHGFADGGHHFGRH